MTPSSALASVVPMPQTGHLLLIGLALACAGPAPSTRPDRSDAEVIDRPLPGAEGGGTTVRLAAGRRPRTFHLTFEREGRGYHAAFDGARWSSPVAVTAQAPFRSGVHMAVAPTGTVHFTWGHDRRSPCHYRRLENGVLSAIEVVEPDAAWGECDLVVDATGRVIVAATRPSEGLGLYQRDAAGAWSAHELPRAADDLQNARWSPALAATSDGRLVVAARKKPGDHPLIWHERDADGHWSEERVIAGNKKEPSALAAGREVILAAVGEANFARLAADGALEVATVKPRARFRRGQRIGLAMTAGGVLYASHADQPGGSANDRTPAPEGRAYVSRSCDGGKTWILDEPVTTEGPGQGWGDVAANGPWVLLVWPDTRGGAAHLRWSLIRESGCRPRQP